MLDLATPRQLGFFTRREWLSRLAVASVLLPFHRALAAAADSPEPWTKEQLLAPDVLARQLTQAKPADLPAIVHVGFANFYRSARIPGSIFHGPGSTQDGLDDLKKWAQSVPRTQSIVLYCGCCPFSDCPNIRPAFAALDAMKFTQLKVLDIKTNFGTDWVQKGYPTDRRS
jgi:thiosulfate/3-mercaptopyruvate sulfurtransferase